MYEFLEGTLVSKTPGRLVLDVHGVGYELAVPIGATFPPPSATSASHGSKPLRVWTHFVVREDSHHLCGFPDRETREVFRHLLSVRGVGPTMALSILSGIQKDDLVRAIADGDAAALVRVKGVGKKTADQILLDLRDKAQKLRAIAHPGEVHGGVIVPTSPREVLVEDAIAALLSIGFTEKEATKSVERAVEKSGAKDLETVLRLALAG